MKIAVRFFLGALIDDHVVSVDGEKRIRDVTVPNWIQPVNDAVVLVGAVLQQTDKLFGTSLKTSTEKAYIEQYWP